MATTPVMRLFTSEGSQFLRKTALQSGEKGLRDIGPLGNLLADMLRGANDRAESRAGQAMSEMMPTATKFAKDKNATQEFVQDLKRKAPATNPEIQGLATTYRRWNNQVYSEAAQAGIKVGPRVNDDWHYMYPSELLKGRGRDQAIKHLVATGQATSTRAAEDILDQMRSFDKVHTLESPRRVFLPGSREDMAVPIDHVTSGLRRIEHAKALGPKYEILDAVLDGIKQQHGQGAYKLARFTADEFLREGMNTKDPLAVAMREVGRNISSLEATAHLGLAVLSHTGQAINTALLTGMKPFVRSLGETIMDYGASKDFALRTGATMQNSLREFRREAASEAESMGSKVLHYTGFQFADKLRRIVAANAGRSFAEQELAHLIANPSDTRALQSLRLMGVDTTHAIANRALSANDMLIASKRVSDITQFRTTALDIPPAWKAHPLTRMLTMYKQFFFEQAKFVKDFAFMPALRDGNYKPLAYMALLFPSLGEVVADVKTLARKGSLKDRPQAVLDRIIDNYAQVGGFGIFHDLIFSFADSTESATRFLVGPVFSDIAEIGHLPFQKHPVDAIEKKILRSIPVLGPYAASKAFPPKNPKTNPLQRGVVTKAVEHGIRRVERVGQ